MKKGVLRNFTKLTGKHLYQSLFLNKVASFRPTILLKRRLWHRCFPVDFAKFLRTPFFKNTSGRLILKFCLTSLLKHGTIIRTRITCKEIPWYMRDSACRWLIVKIVQSYVKHFWIFPHERNCRILIGLWK